MSLLFSVFACVCLAVYGCVWECMISSGDRILRACSNWRANANAWLVALHQPVLKSEVAHSAVQALARGQKQNLVAFDSFILEHFMFVFFCFFHCSTSRDCISCSSISHYKERHTHTFLFGVKV